MRRPPFENGWWRWSLHLFMGAVALALLAGCGSAPQRTGTARVVPTSQKASTVSGAWAAPTTTAPVTTTTTTTTTTTVPVTDPATSATTSSGTTAGSNPTTGAGPDTANTANPPAAGAVSVDNRPASQSDMSASPGMTISQPWGHPWPDHFTVGDAVVSKVPLFSAPGVRMANDRTLSNPTWEGVHLVFLVRQQQGDWLQAQIQSRPNGATAWIRRSDVTLRTVDNHIVVERAAKRISVYHGETLLLSDRVATGSAASPTPTGAFYVDYIGKPATDSGPYGAFQLSATGFSEVYTSFGGGVGQIALHGTNQPELIGQPASHGCVRMTNPTVIRVQALAPTGTPVDILP